MAKELPSKVSFKSDYKYMTHDEAKSITIGQLAKLEADLHNLRLAFVANGENPDLFVGSNRTIKDEMDRVSSIIKHLEEYFSEILNED